MAMMTLPIEGERMTTSSIASRKAGMVWKNSVRRMSTRSTAPR